MTLRRSLSQTQLGLLLLLICAAILYPLGIGSNTFFEDGDSSSHYLIAANAFNHPVLFLHHWGKPFFILVSSPFAAMGMKGVQFFNITCGLAAAWLAFLSARKLGMKYAAYIILLALFAPMYHICLPTGLTEPLFSLVVVGSIYLLLDKRFVLSLLLISFLPFVRSEGLLFWPLFGLCLLFYRRIHLAPLLLGGYVLYTIAGYFVFGDWNWLIHQNPYQGQSSYGHGPLFHFVKHSAATTGIAMAGAFCAGLLYIIYRIFTTKGIERQYTAIETILVFGGSILFIAVHSYLWWKGLMNSAGMLRVVAGVIPLVAIGAMQGAEGLIRLVKIPSRYAPIFLAVSTLAIWNHTFHRHAYRPKMPEGIMAVKKAAEYVRARKTEDEKIFLTDPKAMVFLDLDPFGRKKYPELYNLADKNNPAAELDPGSVVIWDAFFGRATDVRLEPFLASGQFQVLRRYTSDASIPDSDSKYYDVVVLLRK